MSPARASLIADLEDALDSLDAHDARRRLVLADGIDVASNDYLGLAADPEHRARVVESIRDLAAGGPVAAPASRLLRGTSAAMLALEARIADWKGAESALLCASGYQANLALIGTLVASRDRVLSDAHNHASLIDGIRSTGATKEILPHGDLDALGAALARPFAGGRTWVVVESLYSMDGDVAPLDRIAALAAEHDALLIVDDAHASGLFGDRGSGLVEHFGVASAVTASVTTFGKALAASGAAIAGPRTVIDFLVNRARAFIFSTALSPLVMAAIGAGLDAVRDQPARRRRALATADRLRAVLRHAGIDVPGGPGPIVPVVTGENRPTLAVAEAIRSAGFDARAIRPPTVAPGAGRVRLSIHADHEDAMIDRLARVTVAAVARLARQEPSPGPGPGPTPVSTLEAVG